MDPDVRKETAIGHREKYWRRASRPCLDMTNELAATTYALEKEVGRNIVALAFASTNIL